MERLQATEWQKGLVLQVGFELFCLVIQQPTNEKLQSQGQTSLYLFGVYIGQNQVILIFLPWSWQHELGVKTLGRPHEVCDNTIEYFPMNTKQFTDHRTHIHITIIGHITSRKSPAISNSILLGSVLTRLSGQLSRLPRTTILYMIDFQVMGQQAMCSCWIIPVPWRIYSTTYRWTGKPNLLYLLIKLKTSQKHST